MVVAPVLFWFHSWVLQKVEWLRSRSNSVVPTLWPWFVLHNLHHIHGLVGTTVQNIGANYQPDLFNQQGWFSELQHFIWNQALFEKLLNILVRS